MFANFTKYTDSHSQRDPADDAELAPHQGLDSVRRGGRTAQGAQAGAAADKGRQAEGTRRPKQPLHEPNAGGTQR
ncbi:MAG: hypothetical protein MJE68_29300 [Proteobacteria bacterium]|nr:hypothetical protein [Pseudomonadota bacterium]